MTDVTEDKQTTAKRNAERRTSLEKNLRSLGSLKGCKFQVFDSGSKVNIARVEENGAMIMAATELSLIEALAWSGGAIYGTTN